MAKATVVKITGHFYSQKLGGKTIHDFITDEPAIADDVLSRNDALGAFRHFRYYSYGNKCV